jgi:hypothetical protein
MCLAHHYESLNPVDTDCLPRAQPRRAGDGCSRLLYTVCILAGHGTEAGKSFHVGFDNAFGAGGPCTSDLLLRTSHREVGAVPRQPAKSTMVGRDVTLAPGDCPSHHMLGGSRGRDSSVQYFSKWSDCSRHAREFLPSVCAQQSRASRRYRRPLCQVPRPCPPRPVCSGMATNRVEPREREPAPPPDCCRHRRITTVYVTTGRDLRCHARPCSACASPHSRANCFRETRNATKSSAAHTRKT